MLFSIRETPNLQEVNKLNKSIKNADCLIGDINLNPKIPEQRKKLIVLCGKTKYMALDEITTNNGTQLEHVIMEEDLKNVSFATAYLNFASDHKAVAIRIASSKNCFTKDFKEKICFNQDFHTKKKKQKVVDQTNESKESDEHNVAFVHEEEVNLEECQPENRPQDIQLYENILPDSGPETSQSPHSLKVLLFKNPMRYNLCFSNSVASLLLNIPLIQSFLSTKSEQMSQYSTNNAIAKDLIHLLNLPNFSQTSTHQLRSSVHSNCASFGQSTRTFSDRKQHDAGEFLVSIFEHMFKNLPNSINFDEKLFGGLYKESLVCKNGHARELPVRKLTDILMIPVDGSSIQLCLDNYLKNEVITGNCPDCNMKELVKQTEIIADPSTLIIQLKRYSYDVSNRIALKRNDSVEITKAIKMKSGTTYKISSIINHFGDNPEEGHYNILIFDYRNDSFVLLDDQYVKQNVQITSDFKTSSYIVAYTKEN